MLEQLSDLVTFADGIRLIAKVLHQNDDLATIAGINHARIAHQSLLRQAGPRFHDTSSRWGELDGDAGVHPGSFARRNGELLGRVKIVTNIFPRMGDRW